MNDPAYIDLVGMVVKREPRWYETAAGRRRAEIDSALVLLSGAAIGLAYAFVRGAL